MANELLNGKDSSISLRNDLLTKIVNERLIVAPFEDALQARMMIHYYRSILTIMLLDSLNNKILSETISKHNPHSCQGYRI